MDLVLISAPRASFLLGVISCKQHKLASLNTSRPFSWLFFFFFPTSMSKAGSVWGADKAPTRLQRGISSP